MLRKRQIKIGHGTMNNHAKKILIVEDDVMIADCLEEILKDAGFEVCGMASEVDAAILLAQEKRPDLAVIDLRLAKGGLGTEVGAALRALGGIGILYVSGNPEHPALADAAFDTCIPKPYSPDGIVAAIQAALARLAGPALAAMEPA